MAKKMKGNYCQKYKSCEFTKYKGGKWFCVCELKPKFKIRKEDTIRVCIDECPMWDLRPDEALRVSSMLSLCVAKIEEEKIK